MTGKQIITDTLNNLSTERIPWVPYTGIQVGSIDNVPADKLLQEPELLKTALLKAKELYKPDGMPVLFDLQIEAEILGCNLMWAEKAPPSVISHPFANTNNISSLIPDKSSGRLPIVLEVMESLSKEIGNDTALYGLVCGPFTLASHLRGMQLFMDFFENEEYVKSLINYCTDVTAAVSGFYSEAGMDVIAVVDPMVSQISPDTFTQFLQQPFTHLFDDIKKSDKFSSFFVCGDATKNLELMCKTNTDCISVDENIDIVSAKQITDKHDIVVSGNIPLTTIMLHGTQRDNQKYAAELMNNIGSNNFILAPGCDMPYDTPVSNIVGVAQLIHNYEYVNEALKSYTISDLTDDVSLPDYSAQDKVLLEVFTVDSKTCAACGYMTETAFNMIEVFPSLLEVTERKITEKENIAKLKLLGITNLPTILINGEICFVSEIPDSKTLSEKIEEYI